MAPKNPKVESTEALTLKPASGNQPSGDTVRRLRETARSKNAPVATSPLLDNRRVAKAIAGALQKGPSPANALQHGPTNHSKHKVASDSVRKSETKVSDGKNEENLKAKYTNTTNDLFPDKLDARAAMKTRDLSSTSPSFESRVTRSRSRNQPAPPTDQTSVPAPEKHDQVTPNVPASVPLARPTPPISEDTPKPNDSGPIVPPARPAIKLKLVFNPPQRPPIRIKFVTHTAEQRATGVKRKAGSNLNEATPLRKGKKSAKSSRDVAASGKKFGGGQGRDANPHKRQRKE